MSQEAQPVLPPRIVVSAPQGRSGKTTVCIGLCAAFRQRGLTVQPFKKGPDYIDPSWLGAASGRTCHNLDSVLMSEGAVTDSFQRASRGSDIAIIEGAMGLYDGFDAEGRGSTARVSRLLGSPVVLVVNASRMTRSVAALVSGYQHFEPDTGIAGVILNNVSGGRHEQKLVEAVERHCGIPVLGSIPRDSNLGIMERHLGLIPFPESDESEATVERIRQRIEPHVNLDGIMAAARRARADAAVDLPPPQRRETVARIGVMLDRVFTFYYPDNLEALRQAGAELVFIDSIGDRSLPDVDGLYIGGGFPEMFLPELEANSSLRQDVARAVESGLPVYAECAGLMYLCRGIHWQGRRHDMVGVIPAEVELCPRPQGHGYVLARVSEPNPFFPAGITFWGHEFHHSRIRLLDTVRFAYRLERGQGAGGKSDGIIRNSTLASYTHIHALGVPQWGESFVSVAEKYHASRPAIRT